jgi:Fe-S-cluster containining protein
MPDPWYADGLHFSCTRCGHCCTGDPGFVWVDEEELVAIAERLGEPVEEVTAMYTRLAHRGRTLREKSNGDCVFYDDEAGCTIYDVRPRQCRTWPFWPSNVKSKAAWERTKAACPGAGQGELIPAEEITRRLQVIKI